MVVPPDNVPPLPAPAVDPDVYDDDYYLTACAGADEWADSGGQTFNGMYAGTLAKAGLRPGEVVVDIGTGRGELLVVAVANGAARAIGVEYSTSAVELARQTLALHDVTDQAEIHQADARRLPVADCSADLVTMLDIAEHLAPDELLAVCAEAHRILRPGGRLIIHTLPNRSIYTVTYRLQRLRPGRRAWPRDPRNDYERRMHINEQTVSGLARTLRRAGFRRPRVSVGKWVATYHVPDKRAARTYHRLAKLPGLRRLGAGDIWAVAYRAAANREPR
jgi:SAM-dependent methyltransferase